MKDDIQILGCFSFEPIFRNQPLSNLRIKQWILKWYLQRLSKLEFFYIGIYFLFCSLKSVRAASFLFGGKVWLQLVLENYTAVFKRVSKGLHWFCFSSLRDWSTKLAHSLAPIRSKTKKAITTWSPAFSRALGFDWLIGFEFLLAL